MIDREYIKGLYLQLRSYQGVGDKVGLSRQRVHQIVSDYRTHRFSNKHYFRIMAACDHKCVQCGKPNPTVFHFKDFNCNNRDDSNIMPVCSVCQGILMQGRSKKTKYFNQPCYRCEKIMDRKPLKPGGRGFCTSCVAYLSLCKKRGYIAHPYPHTYNRSRIGTPCVECGKIIKRRSSLGHCMTCYSRFRYHKPNLNLFHKDEKCIRCDSDFLTKAYYAKGMCTGCYMNTRPYNFYKPKRYFAIGDVHGHYDELMLLMDKLIKEAKLKPEKDSVVFLGDLVDGGNDTNKVIAQCMKWQKKYPHWVFLKGNHEDLMLDALNPKHPIYGDYYLWWNQGGKETLRSYQLDGFSDYEKAIMQPMDYIPVKHLLWIASLPYYSKSIHYFFVHAGLWNVPIKKHDFKDFNTLQSMLWIREPFIESKFDWGKKVIYGHTHTNEPLVMDNKIGIDTLPRNSGKLTAVELPAEKFYFQPKV